MPNRQPEARLLATLLEFETNIKDETLLKERQSLLRGEGTIMYDVTAWNLTMLHGLDALTVPNHMSANLIPYQPPAPTEPLTDKAGSIAVVINGSNDHSVSFAARAMELGLNVRVIDKDAVLDGIAYPRGSVVVARNDNRLFRGDVSQTVKTLAEELGITAQGFVSGTGLHDLPDIGGPHFVLLNRPRVAVVTRGSTNPLDFGAIWQSIDQYLGIRHSHLDKANLRSSDLRRYNVLVLPDMWQARFSDSEMSKLNAWVKAGGTLIAVKSSAAALSAAGRDFTSVRQIADTFEDRDGYDLALQREWLARLGTLDNAGDIWTRVVPENMDYPWSGDGAAPNKDSLKKQDAWQELFMPQGALVAGRTDQQHWLTFGAGEVLPILISDGPILMSDSNSHAPVRLGVLNQVEQGLWQSMMASSEDKQAPRKIGWATLPSQYELRLRMSGLLWPEAAQRIANTAYLTRESKGNGQIILFADTPVFRGSTLGTNRLFLNAVVYGPGLGARQTIVP